jgi:hypothetical protein
MILHVPDLPCMARFGFAAPGRGYRVAKQYQRHHIFMLGSSWPGDLIERQVRGAR